MESTATFTVKKTLPVSHDTFLAIFLKPARALRLHGQIVAQGAHRYHFRVDGRANDVKEFIAYAAIGAPAFGSIDGLHLWVGHNMYTGAEAVAQTTHHFQPATNPREDHVVPESYV